MEHNDGGPAFPWGEHGQILGGMSLRDYFAAKAMQSFLLRPESDNFIYDEWAAQAYAAADAMLKARGTQS